MKKVKVLLVALLTVISATVFAYVEKEDSEVKIVPNKDGKTYRVIFKSSAEENVSVSILDKNQKKIYASNIIKSDGFSKPYDLSNLPVGDYTFLVETESTKFNQKVDLRDITESDISLTKLNKSNGKVQLLCFDRSHAPLSVFIYDANDDLVYNEVLEEGGVINRIYNLNELKSKNVTFNILSDGRLIKEEKLVL